MDTTAPIQRIVADIGIEVEVILVGATTCFISGTGQDSRKICNDNCCSLGRDHRKVILNRQR